MTTRLQAPTRQSRWNAAAIAGMFAATLCVSASAQSQPAQPAQQPTPPRFPAPPGRPVPPMPGASATAVTKTLFREDQSAAPAVDAATRKANSAEKRVLIIWGGNGGEFNGALKAVFETPDMLRRLAVEYEPVWANVFDGGFAQTNMYLAQAFGAKIAKGDTHAVLMVLDEHGAPVAQQSMAEFVNRVRKGHYNPIPLDEFLVTNRRPFPSAEDVLKTAMGRAKAEVRSVLVRFVEAGDPWGERFEQWLAKPEVAQVFDRNLVMVRIHIQRNSGGGEMFARYAARPESYPWYCMVDDNGNTLALSQPVDGRNIGFPTEDAEIEAFISFVRVGAPGLTEAEAKVLKDSLIAERVARTPVRPPEASTKPPKS